MSASSPLCRRSRRVGPTITTLVAAALAALAAVAGAAQPRAPGRGGGGSMSSEEHDVSVKPDGSLHHRMAAVMTQVEQGATASLAVDSEKRARVEVAAATQSAADDAAAPGGSDRRIAAAMAQVEQGLKGTGASLAADSDKRAQVEVADGPSDEAEDAGAEAGKKKSMFGMAKGLASAAMDPRAALLDTPQVKEFVTTLKAQVEQHGEGKCLSDGKFEGLGCADICECPGWLQECHVAEAKQLLGSLQGGKLAGAVEDVAAMLLGRCQLSMFRLALIASVAAIVLCLCCCGCYAVTKK